MEQNLVIEIKYSEHLSVLFTVVGKYYKSVKALNKAVSNFIRAIHNSKNYLINPSDYFYVMDKPITSFISTMGIRMVAVYTESIYNGLNHPEKIISEEPVTEKVKEKKIKRRTK